MRMEINRMVLAGYVGNIPEIRYTQDGKKIGTMSVATHRRGKESFTDWHRVVTYHEGIADIMEKQVERGSYVYAEGRLQTRKWQDKQGRDHYTTEIILDLEDHILLVSKHEKYQASHKTPLTDFLAEGENPEEKDEN
jgi:single-strand DNA-binding protein